MYYCTVLLPELLDIETTTTALTVRCCAKAIKYTTINKTILTTYFVNWVVIIKFYETKASFLSCSLISNYANILYISIIWKVFSQLIFIMVIFNATNK